MVHTERQQSEKRPQDGNGHGYGNGNGRTTIAGVFERTLGIALDAAIRMGRISRGSTVVLIAFGAGLTWAGTVLRL